MATTLKSKFLTFFLIASSLFLFFLFSKPALSAQTPYKVSGWAWSSTVGWVSFNCINLNSCATIVYGVSLDPSTGVLSGYAWSDAVGWISFNQPDLVGCPNGSCEAKISGGLTSENFPKLLTGWAKVLSNKTWINLHGIASNGDAYSVQLENSGDFSGFSWEGSTLGWLSWGGPNYGVRTELSRELSVRLRANGQDDNLTVAPGIEINLSWSTANASRCEASSSANDWKGLKGLNFFESVGKPNSSRNYTLTCFDISGKSVSDAVQVNISSTPVPSVRLTANGIDDLAVIPYDNSATLAWTSSNVVKCSASGDWQNLGDKPLSGQESTPKLTATKVYNLTCTDPNGKSASDSVTLQVSPKPEPLALTLKGNDNNDVTTVLSGGNVNLAWQTSGNLTSCVASGNWNGTKPLNGSETISNITSPKNFLLSCSNAAGTAISDSLQVLVETLKESCGVFPPDSFPSAPQSPALAEPPGSDSQSLPDYGIYIDETSGVFSGKMWTSAGWLSFDSADLSGCSETPCEAKVSGGLTGTFPKNAFGWGKFLSSGTWVKLRGLSSNNVEYGIMLNKNGDFSGWSCSPNNLGWMSWDGANYKIKVELPPATPKYSCNGNACVLDPNGAYDQPNCNNACQPPPQRYSCSNNACVSNPNGPYTTSNCNNACGQPPVYGYSCINRACSLVLGGEYETENECNKNCGEVPPENRYSCQNNACVLDLLGQYTSSSCDNACGQPPYCGNGVCENGEDSNSCPNDCSTSISSIDLKVNNSDGPVTVPYNSPIEVSWNIPDEYSPELCVASEGWFNDELTGSETIENLTQSQTLELICPSPLGSGVQGSSDSVSIIVEPPAGPQVSIQANSQNNNIEVPAGTTVEISWNSINAHECVADGSWTGNKSLSSGSNPEVIQNITEPQIYILTCIDEEGKSAADNVTVNIGTKPEFLPSINLAANDTSVPSGGSVTLNWEVENADSCAASSESGNWIGPKNSENGSETISHLIEPEIFTLTCSNENGSNEANLAINIESTDPDLPIINFFAENNYIQSGEAATLIWQVQNADNCLASSDSGQWFGNKDPNGDYEKIENMTASDVFTLACSNSHGDSEANVAVNIDDLEPLIPPGTPILDIKADNQDDNLTIPYGSSVEISWTSENMENCVASGAWDGPQETNGSLFTESLIFNSSYIIMCKDDSGRSAIDAVTVNVEQEGDIFDVIEEIPTPIEFIQDPAKANRKLQKLRKDPVTRQAAQDVAIPVSIGVGAVSAGIITTTALNIAIILQYLEWLCFYLIGLLRFKKRHPWGKVSDRFSGSPIPGAIVQIYESQFKKLKDFQITDHDGRFSTFVGSGSYFLKVSKPGFQLLETKVLTIDEKNQKYSLELYLAPLEETVFSLRYLRSVHFWELTKRVLNVSNTYLLIFGTVISLVVVVLFPKTTNVIIFALYMMFDAYRFYSAKHLFKPFGIVLDHDAKTPLALSVVKVFEEKSNSLIGTKVTNPQGRFDFLLGPGSYYFTCLKSGYEPLRSDPITLKKAGLASLQIEMDRI